MKTKYAALISPIDHEFLFCCSTQGPFVGSLRTLKREVADHFEDTDFSTLKERNAAARRVRFFEVNKMPAERQPQISEKLLRRRVRELERKG